MNILRDIYIPNYIRRVKLSEERRAIPYVWYGHEEGIRGKRSPMSKGKRIPNKYLQYKVRKGKPVQPYQLKTRYIMVAETTGVNNLVLDKTASWDEAVYECKEFYTEKQMEFLKFYIRDAQTGQRVIANPNVAGTPKWQTIRGQDFYSGNLNHYARNKIMFAIKQSFVPFVMNVKPLRKEDYPVYIVTEIHDSISNELSNGDEPWDVRNRVYPYGKAIEDLLVTGHCGDQVKQLDPVLVDDDRLHVVGSFDKFVPIDNENMEVKRWITVKIVKCTNEHTNKLVNEYKSHEEDSFNRLLGDKGIPPS